jgi:hypothetical protein
MAIRRCAQGARQIAGRHEMTILSTITERAGDIVSAIRVYSELKHDLGKFLRPYSPSNNPQSIEGRWKVNHIGDAIDGDELEASWSIEVVLKQAQSHLSGTATARCISGSSAGHNVSYNVRGVFAASIVDVAFQEASLSSRNRSVFLLQPIGDGTLLEGYRTFFGRNKNVIRVIACKWERFDNPAPSCGTA